MNMVYHIMNKNLEVATASFTKEEASEDEMQEEAMYEETGSSSYVLCFYEFATGETTKNSITLDENEYVSKIIKSVENKLIFLTEKSEYTEESSSSSYYIAEYNMDTKEINKTDITEALEADSDYLYFEYVEIDSEGNCFLGNGESGVWVFDKEYNLETHIPFNYYLNAMALTKDGEVVVAMYTDNGDSVIRKYDQESKMFENEIKIDFASYSQNALSPGVEKDLIVGTEEGLSEYSLEDNKMVELVNWINSDINSNYLRNFKVLDDGRILLFMQNWDAEGNAYELVYLTKMKTSELPEKKLISLKTLFLGYELKNKVIEFNKNNAEYRVVVETYDTTDYEAALTKYQTDLGTGNASDIIDLSYGDIEGIASKGVLTDLYTFIDGDEEFAREDFFENVLEAYTVDGKLTAVMPSVYLLTMVGKTKFVGEEAGWTPADIVELANSLPEDTKLLEYGSKKDVLSMLVSYDLNSYIDWQTGECKFNTDSFLDIMEFANKFPTQEEYEAMFEDENFDYGMMNSEDKIASDKLILLQGYFSEITDYQYTMARFNEPAICVGFPCVEETGAVLGASGTALGINDASDKKDGAWQFIRYLLTEEAAEDMWGLPVNKNAYNKKMEKATEVEYFSEEEVEEGWVWVPEEQRRVSEDGRVERPVNSISFGNDNEEVFIYAPTQEMVDDFTELYMSTSSLASYNSEVLKIVIEEAESYFSGQKEAQEVADIIQSRLQIYINENK